MLKPVTAFASSLDASQEVLGTGCCLGGGGGGGAGVGEMAVF